MSLLRSYTVGPGPISIPVDQASAGSFPVVRDNIIAGTVTLSGGLVVSPSGTPVTGQRVVITWNASVTPSGNTITIFGETVPTELAARNFVAECLWDGTGGPWVVNILPDFAGVGIVAADRIAANAVTTAKIADDAVTLAKMAGLAKGNIIYGDASGDPASVNLGAVDANLVVGDTTNGVAVVAMSGDATIAKTGALTIANNAVTTAKILDDNVTAAKLDDDANRVQVVIPTSFETAGEIGAVYYKICFPCTIEGIHGTVTKPFTSTGTHIFKNNGGTVLTGSQIDMASGLLLGNIVSSTPTANNTFVAGDVIRIETSVFWCGRRKIFYCAMYA